jgi:hypothetical protein
MSFQFFDFIDPTLVDEESFDSYAVKTPAVWPSDASAVAIDKTVAGIVGKCHLASYFRMIGQPTFDTVDAVGAMRFRLGRMVEEDFGALSKLSKPPIFVGSGIRCYIPEIGLSFELDLIVKDPVTHQGVIGEVKSYYGYYSGKSIQKDNKPKEANLLQACVYLAEIQTGKRLKELIRKCQQNKVRAEAAAAADPKNQFLRDQADRYRIVIDEEMLAKMSDGPLAAKLLYVARDEGHRKEFDISFDEHLDGFHYPLVNNVLQTDLFTLESVYERWSILQDYWLSSRREAVARLARKGIHCPAHVNMVLDREALLAEAARREQEDTRSFEQKKEEREYLKLVAEEVRNLPKEFFPPAEYEFRYSDEKIERLYKAGEIGEGKYKKWSAFKRGTQRKPKTIIIGDWGCSYCNHRRSCIGKFQAVDMAHLVNDLNQDEEEEVIIG